MPDKSRMGLIVGCLLVIGVAIWVSGKKSTPVAPLPSIEESEVAVTADIDRENTPAEQEPQSVETEEPGTLAEISGILLNYAGDLFPKRGLYIEMTYRDRQIYSTLALPETAKFTFIDVIPGTYGIYLAQNYPYEPTLDPVLATVTVTAGEHLENLELTITETIEKPKFFSGRIVDDRGVPIADAEISGKNDGDWDELEAVRSDANGDYLLPNVQEGMYNLDFSARGHASVFTFSGQTRTVNVTLNRLGIINGIVIDESTGEPLEKFEMKVNDNYYRAAIKNAGNFQVTAPKENAFAALTVKAQGYAELRVGLPAVRYGETIERFRVEMQPANTVRGEVRNINGEPIADASIRLIRTNDIYQLRSNSYDEHTDENGLFVLKDLPRGPVTFLVIKEHDYQEQTHMVSVNQPETHTRITMRQGGELRVLVTKDGKPIRATVLVRSEQERLPEPVIWLTNMEEEVPGTYFTRDLPEGVVRVAVSSEAVDGSGHLSTLCEITDEIQTLVKFNFESGTSSVEGYLLDPDGNPLKGEVKLTRTDGDETEFRHRLVRDDGHYQFDLVQAGGYALMANLERHASMQLIPIEFLDNEQHEINFSFEAGAKVTCRVADRSHNELKLILLVSAGVTLPPISNYDDFYHTNSGVVAKTTGYREEYTFTGIEPGNYDIVALYLQHNFQNEVVASEVTTIPFTIHDLTDHDVEIVF